MKLFLSIFVSISAIVLAVYYNNNQEQFTTYMRGILRPTTAINLFSKNLNLSRSLLTPSSTMVTAPSSTFIGLPVIPPNDASLNAENPKSRGIAKIFEAIEQSEGAGATVRRSIGTPKLRNFSPFLMLDHFSVGVGAGFPDHPHRGQETITYLLSGAVDHEDFAGNKGVIYSGDLQFMTAGRGIVHAEMPHDNGDGSPNVGMQLWVDLPKELKFCEPRYRDLRSSEIPVASTDDGKVKVKVISGRSQGVDSLQELAYTPVWLLDITIQPGGRVVQGLPSGWNAFAYTLEGTVFWDTGATKQKVEKFHNTVFEQKGDQIIAEVAPDAKESSRFILVAGQPLLLSNGQPQPIIQHGPFVLTSPAQVREAMMDYSTSSNGFERANGWESEIGKAMG